MSNHVVGVGASKVASDPAVESLMATPEIVPKQEKVMEQKPVLKVTSKAAGLDIGTMNIISAFPQGNDVTFKRIRDVFIDLSQEQVKMLKLSGNTSYITKGDVCYVLGDDAADIANIFGRKLRNPLNKGVISAGELEAMEILKVMVGEVLGQAPEGGVCFVSSPGDPIDNDFDALYHQAVITEIVSSYGWDVETASESTAMAYSECADTNFTGLCISCGHGMCNISLIFRAIETIRLSISRGGSWLDEQTAKVTGKTSSQICAIKEKGIDLLKPIGKEQQALVVYYKHLIKYMINSFIMKFKQLQGNIELPEEIPCVIAGGTSMPKGFIDLVRQAINAENGFPFALSEVRHAKDPLNSIAKGLLVMAQNKSL
jgi:hypothetical protein